MQPQTMQHRTRALHHNQHRDRQRKPHHEEEEDGEDPQCAVEGEGVGECHGPEDDGELLVSEGEGPEAEVGGGMGDAVEAEFYCQQLA